jgi:hypothetical protein
MAANPVVYIHNGIVKVPAEMESDPRFREGAALQLVPVAASTALPGNQAAGDWHRLRGALADLGVSLNEELNQERLEENLRDTESRRGLSA